MGRNVHGRGELEPKLELHALCILYSPKAVLVYLCLTLHACKLFVVARVSAADALASRLDYRQPTLYP